MRKKVFLMGSLLALVILLGATHAYAESSASSKQNGHGWNDSIMEQVATKLNLSSDDLANMKSEIASGTSIKDVLAQYNITLAEVRTALGTAGNLEHNRASNTQIAAIAAKLGLDATTIQNDIASGKNLQQIMSENNITQAQLESAIASMHHGVGSKKSS